MKKLLNLIFFILCAPLCYAFVAQTVIFFFVHFNALWSDAFLYGAAGYFVLYSLFWWRKLTFLEVLEHELNHTVVAYLFFRNVIHLEADWRKGGHILAFGKPNTIILLAPYFLPLFTLPLIIVKPFMSASTHMFVDFFMGLTWAFHIVGLINEFSPRQDDLKAVGMRASFLIVLVMNCIFAAITLGFALEQYAAVGAYFKEAFLRAWKIYVWVWTRAFVSAK